MGPAAAHPVTAGGPGLSRYPVEVVALAVSAGHSYWFHSRDPAGGVGPHPTQCPQSVEVVAGHGIRGDRFFGTVGTLRSAVTFVAAEAVEQVAVELGMAPDALDPVLMRRNVVLRGVDLNVLRHHRFGLAQGAGVVWFEAAGETSPCAWMDAVLAPGARDLLRGRGGLRTTPTSRGTLRVGTAELLTDVVVDPGGAGDRLRRADCPERT